MLSELDKVRLRHMLDGARAARRLAEGRGRADLDNEDDPLLHALVRLITVIGEAAKNVSPEARSELAGIPWPDVVGMRHHLVHAYFDIDLDLLWNTVQVYVPELIGYLEPALQEDEAD